jgi:hypothetical protein
MEIGHPATNALSTRMISRTGDPVAKRRKLYNVVRHLKGDNKSAQGIALGF